MSSLTLGLVTGLIAALGFGFGDYFAAKASRRYSAIQATFWTQTFQLVIVGVLFVVLGWQWQFKPIVILYAFLYGATFFTGLTLAWRAFRIGPVSIASSFVSSYALVAVIIAIIFLHERITLQQQVAVLVMIAGAMLCSLHGDEKIKGSFWKQPVIIYAFLGAAGIGASLTFVDLMVKAVGWQTSALMQSVGAVSCAAVMLKARGDRFLPEGKVPLTPLTIAAAISLETGGIMFSYGFSAALVAIVAPVASISPLITMALSLIYFRERLSSYQYAGVGGIVAGLVLLAA